MFNDNQFNNNNYYFNYNNKDEIIDENIEDNINNNYEIFKLYYKIKINIKIYYNKNYKWFNNKSLIKERELLNLNIARFDSRF